MDEFYGPNHPLKTRWRELNKECTRLFISQEKESHFFDAFQKQDLVVDRNNRFKEELVQIYHRSKKTGSVSPDLIEQMQSMNSLLKKENNKIT